MPVRAYRMRAELFPSTFFMPRRQKTLGHIAALLTILIWGTTFVSTISKQPQVFEKQGLRFLFL